MKAELAKALTAANRLLSEQDPDGYALRETLRMLAEAVEADAPTKPEPANPRKGFFYWTVEFGVSDNWVADGFELNDARALEMLANDLRWANIGMELKAKVLTKPPKKSVKKAQGGGS